MFRDHRMRLIFVIDKTKTLAMVSSVYRGHVLKTHQLLSHGHRTIRGHELRPFAFLFYVNRYSLEFPK
jgi:hypothetical protein